MYLILIRASKNTSVKNFFSGDRDVEFNVLGCVCSDQEFLFWSNEQKVFDKNLKGIPGVIAVLVGPPSCGKSRFLKEMVDRLGLGQDPPPKACDSNR
ncbi:hypothetical protein Ndes2437B_g08267 [Nannochloris sp. 'desiccata']